MFRYQTFLITLILSLVSFNSYASDDDHDSRYKSESDHDSDSESHYGSSFQHLPPLQQLQQGWAKAQYQTSKAQQEDAFEDLSKLAKKLAKQNPQSAELLIWKGIILSSRAGAEGGLSALSLIKKAKSSYESALKLDPQALNGSAYTSLGVLYYKAPGWPISFGDDDVAKNMLEKALAINPNGIDPNYFMGDYWLSQGKKNQAKASFEKALQASPRASRPIADKGRRQEILQALERI